MAGIDAPHDSLATRRATLDNSFQTKVDQIVTDCIKEIQLPNTQDEVFFGTFYQALTALLCAYRDIYQPLETQSPRSTWTEYVKQQIEQLKKTAIDYTAGAHQPPAEQLRSIFSNTKNAFQGSTLWRLMTGVGYALNWIVSIIVSRPDLGSHLLASMNRLEDAYEAALKARLAANPISTVSPTTSDTVPPPVISHEEESHEKETENSESVVEAALTAPVSPIIPMATTSSAEISTPPVESTSSSSKKKKKRKKK